MTEEKVTEEMKDVINEEEVPQDFDFEGKMNLEEEFIEPKDDEKKSTLDKIKSYFEGKNILRYIVG
jgi:hypothetical protein